MATQVGNLTAVLKKKGDLVLEDTPIPQPGKNEVQLCMQAVGICGSDVHYWIDGRIGDYFVLTKPMILGHEGSGIVSAIGEGVTNLKIGDRVAVEPGVPCRQCEQCKTGRYNLCSDVVFCATPPHHGSLRRYYCHAADFCYKLPDHVSLEEGALLEPLSVATHACRRAGVTLGSCVLVCGAGPIGLMSLLAARALGASKIAIIDIAQNRLDMAKQLGADYPLLVDTKDTREMANKVHAAMGCEPNISIECSGAEQSVQTGVLATKSGGVFTVIGHGPKMVSIPIVEVTAREIDVRGCLRYANDYQLALEMIATGKVNAKPLITHHFPLEKTLDAFETSRTGAGGAIKVIIHCNE